MAVITLTEENFDKTVAVNDMVLVDFWAQWCGPCRIFSEIYSRLSEKYKDVLFGTVNIEEEHQLVQDFQVQSIPMLVVFRGGIVVYAASGALTQSALEDVIQKAKTLDLQEIHKDIAAQERHE